jgi:hypothetical protein
VTHLSDSPISRIYSWDHQLTWRCSLQLLNTVRSKSIIMERKVTIVECALWARWKVCARGRMGCSMGVGSYTSRARSFGIAVRHLVSIIRLN